MHGIGNEHDAQTIYFWVASQRREYDKPLCAYSKEAPLGWEYVASGSFRSVWRSPEGVAYKVEHCQTDYSHQSAEEIENLKKAWEKGAPEGCRLPRFDEFRVDGEVIVAVEYIDGPTLYEYDGPENDLYERLEQCEFRFALSDLHDENALVDDDGLLVPVDLGG